MYISVNRDSTIENVRFDESTDSVLIHSPAGMVALSVPEARKLAAELVRVVADRHQPRERAVPCATCGLDTWEPSGRCAHHER